MRIPSPAVLVLVVGLGLAGCAKNVDTRVAGSDDATIDAASARLEELGARARRDDLSCPDRCDVGTKTCAEAEGLCRWVERHPDRDDLPPRCAQAREQCASASDGCTRCQNG
jgi:hypothetical protein